MVRELSAESCQSCGALITSVRDCKSRRAGFCSKCYRRLYDKAYRDQHRGQYKAYQERYYQVNREKLREKNTVRKRAWRDANRLRYREYQRNYKRRIRNQEEYQWESLPVTCGDCGEDISTRLGTRSRRQGLCPRCYRRQSQKQYYRRTKQRQPSSNGVRLLDGLKDLAVS